MADVKLGSVRVLGVGHLGVAIASYFNGDTLTSGLDYDSESIRDCRVDNALQLKEFDGGFGSKMNDLLGMERKTILDNFSGNLIFVVAQTEGRFQEAIIPPLLKILKSTGSFMGFFPIIPIGADKKRELEKVQRMRTDLDMLEFIDSEDILQDSKNQRILDINNRYYKHIWEKVVSIARVVDNSTALGISLHDIKMLTNLYGPVRLSSFTYPFVNFSIAERDLFEEVNKLPREKIKRIYMVLEIGNDVDSSDVILFVRKVKNRLGNIDFRQGFIHTQGDFGLIILNFGSF
ncbi:MAG: hypothetical protein M0Z77_09930 [Thermoplasmatales archaeon]|nr:hypothetical protein [Candidatus Thermoplasmatota archaeon]MCL6002920.1 hypothetical protein [Candidatus Thermoplasmatota archaeon]MDA8055944.1 hypothetical protein [Thermoplasmatales archaeon]